MASPLFDALGNQPQGGFGQMIQQFQQFKNSFNGDPKQQVQNLLNSGKMSQAQFNQLSQMANQLMGILK